MVSFRAVVARFRGWFVRTRLGQRLDEELRTHFDMLVEDEVRRGKSRDEAKRLARLRLGGLEQTRESVQDVRAFCLEGVWHDLLHSTRMLRRNPGFAAMAIITLAVAVGANASILAIADGVLFRPLPFEDPDRVFLLQMMNRQTGKRYTLVPYDYIEAINRRHPGLSDAGMFDGGPAELVGTPDGVESVSTIQTTSSYFPILGVRPARGRLFTAQDVPGRTAMLTWTSWKTRFGGDAEIIGRTISLGKSSFEVIGVLPPNFLFPTVSFFSGKPEVVTLMAPIAPGTDGGTFHPVVRLAPGVSRLQAQARLEALAASVNAGDARRADDTPFLVDIRSTIYPIGQPIMKLLLAAAALVLLIGCSNLANMLLVRGRRREKETAVRAALGASRLRLIRPVLFEALLIAAAGSALALCVIRLSFDTIARQVPNIAVENVPIGVDTRVVLMSLGLGLLGGLIFAIVPAWRSARLNVLGSIQGQHGNGLRTGRLGRPMIAVQVGLAIVLVFGAVVTTRAFLAVLRTPLGFDPDNVISVSLGPPRGTTDVVGFYRRIVETLRARKDVVAAGATGLAPLAGNAPWGPAYSPGSKQPAAGVVHVVPGYFETLSIRLIRGRLLTWEDTGGEAAVVSESAARALFGGADPLGQILNDGRGQVWRVVGLIGEVRWSLDREGRPPVYVIPRGPTTPLQVFARVRGHQGSLPVEIRRQLSAAVPGIPIRADWWTDSIGALTAYKNPRFQTLVLTSFAAMALGLTVLGVFGVVASLVATRTREMGIRVAIGASPQSLVRLFLRQTLLPVAAGLVLGLLATHWAARLAEAQLFKVDTHDPTTLALAGVAVVGTALIAAYLPARRAARVDPIVVLRAE
ncbi:MAG: ABC transporter permease [Acidobacteriia bacterium]|nr:ABC transporter permease [Terriglobia bacterium]